MTFFSPSAGLKCSYSAICHHCLRNFICCNHPGHRSFLLQNDWMVLSDVQLDICLSTATIVHTITGPYMQSSRERLIILMYRFCYHVHVGSHQNQRSSCLDSLIRSRWDNFSSNSTGQLIQLEKIFHSLVGVWCMIFELRRFLSCSLSCLDHSLLESYFFSQFGERSIVLNPFPDVVQHLNLSLFHSFKNGVFCLHAYHEGHLLPKLGVIISDQGNSIQVIG